MSINSMLPFGLTVDMLIVLLAGLSAFASVFAVWNALLAQDPMSSRVRDIRRRRDELRAGISVGQRNRHRQHQRSLDTMSLMRSVAQRFNLMRTKTADKVTLQLAQAGWRSRDAAVTFMVMKISLPFVFGGVAFVLFNLMDILNLSPMARIIVPVGAVAGGFYAPEVFVRNATMKRQKLMQKGLPDALDLLVICAEAGLALDAGLQRAAREMARACPQIADEFGLTAVELGFLPERRKALENLARRTGMSSIRGVVNTLMQTEKYGTPLAQSLRVLSAEFRNERMMKAEEKAAKLPAILTVPLIVFILPTLFIVLVGPAILRTMDALGSM